MSHVRKTYKLSLQLQGYIRKIDNRVNHYSIEVAWEGWPLFGDKLMDLREISLIEDIAHLLRNQDTPPEALKGYGT